MTGVSSDEADFREFFAATGPALRRTAFLIVRDWHLAEDMTQQTMAKLYSRWRRVRPETRVAYARRVVVNECLSYLRRKRREVPVEDVPETPASHNESPYDLGSILAALPPQQRAIVALRFIDDIAVTDVADMLGIAPGTVKSQTSRAMATLRTHLHTTTVEDSQ